MRQRLISTDEAQEVTCQHRTPCSDCPWTRESLPGWLGGSDTESWLAEVRSDGIIPCHTKVPAQCAGAAIFRRNIVKSPRDPNALKLPRDTEVVFAHDGEFREHHEGYSK